MKIRYYRKNIYGVEQCYPVDLAGPISKLTGRVTLTQRDFDALDELGFEFEEILYSEAKKLTVVVMEVAR